MSSQQQRDVDQEFERIDGNLRAFEQRIKSLQETVDTLEETVRDVDQRVATIEAQVQLDMDEKDYEQLTREDKAREIQSSLIHAARESPTDKAAMNYREVRFLFNGRPSTGHCYDLMDLAAQEDGFDYEEREEHENRITVNLPDVNDELVVHAVNNDDGSGGR